MVSGPCLISGDVIDTGPVNYNAGEPTCAFRLEYNSGHVVYWTVTYFNVGGLAMKSMSVSVAFPSPPPTVTGLSPSTGATAGGTSVVVTGTNFTGVTAVRFGGTNALYSVNSATQITATSPAGSAGVVNVTVTTADGTSATGAANQYTYVAPSIPTVTSISPNTGTTAGGTAVVLTGTNFTGVTSVRFGVTNAAGFTVNSATQITATSPARPAGTANITVTNANGTSATAAGNQYTFSAPPSAPTVTGPGNGSTVNTATPTYFGTADANITVTVYVDGSAIGTTTSDGAGSWIRVQPTSLSSGSHTVYAMATNGGGLVSANSATNTFTYASLPQLAPAAGALPGATAGAAYSQTFTTTGGAAPYSYAITAGALPAGLSLASGGVMSGTPAATGAFNFSVRVTDGNTNTNTVSYTLTVGAPTVTLAPVSLPNGAVAQGYSASLTASGGTAIYTYAVTAGSLPFGITLSSGGTLSGTPMSGGTYTFTITATDSTTGVGAPFTGSRAYTLTIAAPTIALTPTTLTGATAGVAYSQAISASGGTAPYTYAVTSGVLPAGLTLASNGTLSGTPSAGGIFNFTATATDSTTGTGPFTGSRAYTLMIAAPTIALTPTILPDATEGTAYSQSFTASGGVAPYGYTMTGTLPWGMTFANGTLSGTPNAGSAGTYPITIVAYDSATGTGPFGGARSYTLTVNAAPVAPVAGAVSATVAYNSASNPITLNITGGTPTSVSVGTAATHGTATASGTSITYTPTAGYYGADSFTYAATNANGTSAAATATITVSPPAAPTAANRSGVAVAYDSLGTAIDLTASITGVHTSLAVATQPAHGTTSVTGSVVTYVPTSSYYGADSFIYTATGPGGTSAPATVSLTVATPPPPLAAPINNISVPFNSGGTSINLASAVSGVYSSVSISSAPGQGTLSGVLPNVLYTPATGYSGADSFTYTATGPGGTSASAMVSLVVAAPPPPTPAPTVADTLQVSIPAGSGSRTIDLRPAVSGDYTSIDVTGAPSHGVVTLSGGFATYIPVVGYVGTDSFLYAATGPGGTSASAIARILMVAPPAPVATGQSNMAVTANTTVPIDLAALVTGDYTSISIVSGPAHGDVRQSGTVVSYTPSGAYAGADSITFQATGPGGVSNIGTITFTVAGIRPTARDITLSGTEGNALIVDVLTGATGGPFTGVVVLSAGKGSTATIMPAMGSMPVGRLYIELAPGSSGTVRVSYAIFNANGVSEPATITITVAQRPDPERDAAIRSQMESMTQSLLDFAQTQQNIFSQRLDRLHSSVGTSTSQFALNVTFPDVTDPGTSLARMERAADQAVVARFLPADTGLPGQVGEPQVIADRGVRRSAPMARADALSAAPAGQQDGSGIGIWTGGTIAFGTQDGNSGREKVRISSTGVSIGADVRIRPGAIVGIGGGYGWDRSEQEEGPVMRGRNSVAVVYGSFVPAKDLFVDAQFGLGSVSFRTNRAVDGVAGEATARRGGALTMGSIAFGVDTGTHTRWSLYGRGEWLDATLDAYQEGGGGAFALRFDERQIRSLGGVLGGRVSRSLDLGKITVRPRLKAEWRHEFRDASSQGVDYADTTGPSAFRISGTGWASDQLEAALGSAFALPDAWTVDLELGLRASNTTRTGAVRVELSKQF